MLADEVHIGNFVEVKNTTIGKGSKANHLTYLGDATIGTKTNIGAGTITCNYDGVNKYQTVIGDEVRIGSDTMLVAPVKIGDKATTGAGSVITKDCEPNKLVVARARQTVVEGWVRPEKPAKDQPAAAPAETEKPNEAAKPANQSHSRRKNKR